MEIRRYHQHGEYIFKVTNDKGNEVYVKNICTLTEDKPVKYALTIRIKREEGHPPVLIAEDCLMEIQPQEYIIIDENISYYSIASLFEIGDTLMTYDTSYDNISWKRCIRRKYPHIYFFQHEYQIISRKRIVAQNIHGNWTVLDFNNNTIVPFGRYSRIDGFKFNVAKVKIRRTVVNILENTESTFDVFGIIDIDGKEVVECVYDTIYKFYGNNLPYTKLFKDNKVCYFHLGYQMYFGSLRDLEYLQYLEDQGEIEWKGW